MTPYRLLMTCFSPLFSRSGKENSGKENLQLALLRAPSTIPAGRMDSYVGLDSIAFPVASNVLDRRFFVWQGLQNPSNDPLNRHMQGNHNAKTRNFSGLLVWCRFADYHGVPSLRSVLDRFRWILGCPGRLWSLRSIWFVSVLSNYM